jgi:hypothetical protein
MGRARIERLLARNRDLERWHHTVEAENRQLRHVADVHIKTAVGLGDRCKRLRRALVEAQELLDELYCSEVMTESQEAGYHMGAAETRRALATEEKTDG